MLLIRYAHYSSFYFNSFNLFSIYIFPNFYASNCVIYFSCYFLFYLLLNIYANYPILMLFYLFNFRLYLTFLFLCYCNFCLTCNAKFQVCKIILIFYHFLKDLVKTGYFKKRINLTYFNSMPFIYGLKIRIYRY